MATTRIAGFKGALYLAAVKVSDIYDITVELTTDIADATIKGETFQRKIAGPGTGRLTAKRRLNTTAIMAREALDSANLGEQLAFEVDVIDAQAGFTQITGFGFISQGSLSLPQDAVDETIEMIIDGSPGWTTPGAT